MTSLTYDLDTDVRQAMAQYDVILDSYQRQLQAREDYGGAMNDLLTQIAA